MTLHKHASPAVARRSMSQPALIDPTADFPDIYGMAVVGDCMAPEIPDGCNIKVSKSEAFSVKDIVVVWLRPDLVKPGMPAAVVKRLEMALPPWVTFPYRERPDTEVQAICCLSRNDMPGMMATVRCVHIAAIHKCLGILKPEETSEDFRQQAMRDRSKTKQIPDHSPAIQINRKRLKLVSEVSP